MVIQFQNEPMGEGGEILNEDDLEDILNDLEAQVS